MAQRVEELLYEVLSLGEKDRASLAGALIESLHGESEPGAEATWEAVIKRRVEELDASSAKTVP